MNTQEKIEFYLEGKLSQEEKKIFEDELANNKELANEVNQRKLLLDSISASLTYPSGEINNDENFNLTPAQNVQIEEDIIKFHHNYVTHESEDEVKLKNLIKKIINKTCKFKWRKIKVIMSISAGIIFILIIFFSLVYFGISR